MNSIANFFKNNFLLLTVFITGACVLIIEVLAVRILSPYYGNTIFTVSSIISIILAALSLGYYFGGRMADKYPSTKWFFGIILISGIVLLMLHLCGLIILPMLSYLLPMTTGPLISSFILFFLPALLLGMLSPYAIKLQQRFMPEQGIGTISGKIFFFSTLGSIFGSLSAGFIFIPRFGINNIIIGTSIVLFLLGLLPLLPFGLKGDLKKAIGVFVIALSLTMFLANQTKENVVLAKDGVYEKLAIYDGYFGKRPARFFYQDRSASGAMFLDSNDPTDMVYEYTKYFSLYKIFKPEIKNALVIGGGAYTIPKALLHEQTDANIYISEIEPSLHELAQKYFGLIPSPKLQNFTEDGRHFLRDSNNSYDLIFSDVYYSLYSIPAHFTTKEFFQLAKDKLNPEGIFLANLIGDLSTEKPSLIMSEIKTFQEVFPNSYFFAADSPSSEKTQNIIFVGYNSSNKITKETLVRSENDFLRKAFLEKQIDVSKFDLLPHNVMTDDFSPADYMTAKVIERSFDKLK